MPSKIERRFLPVLAVAGLAVLLAGPGCAVWRASQSAELAKRSQAYQQTPAQATVRLLVVGDSTAVGTGASDAAHSVAGLMGQTYPKLAIENRAFNGAQHADVLQQLQRGGRFDIVLVQAGGNDVIRLRDLQDLTADVQRVTQAAKQLAPLVVLMPCGNVGNAPFFFAPVSWWMTNRARELHRIVSGVAQQQGAVYVGLFHERDADPFVKDPSLNANDGLHPSDGGYAVWWQRLNKQPELVQALAAAR